MRLGTVHPGDIVRCDVRADIFLAFVSARKGGELQVESIGNGRGRLRLVRARQVRQHWRRAGRRSARAS